MTNIVQDLNLKEGEIVMTSSGEYSDYSVGCLIKVLKDFDIATMLPMLFTMTDKYSLEYNEYGTINTYKSNFGEHYGIEGALMELLEEFGFVEIIEYRELHTGCYGDVEFNLT